MKRDISEELKVIDTFFTLFEDPNAKVDELIEKCREIFFVKPIVIAISEHYLKDYKETFTKLHLFWLIALTLNLENGDICVKIDENSINNLFLNRICANFYENDELIAITKELAETLRKNRTIDWNRREQARARMRMLIKRLLKKHKYPPEGMDDAVQTVMTQCELWTDNMEE